MTTDRLLPRRPSLRSSIVAGLLLVITLVSVGFTYAVRAAFDQLDVELLDQRLVGELREFKEAYEHDPTIPPVNWGGLRRYVQAGGGGGALPEALISLTAGVPQRILLEGHEHLAGSVQVADATLYVTLDVAAVPAIESSLINSMVAFLLIGYALALLFGWLVATRVSRPLALLAARVARAEPTQASLVAPLPAAPREVSEIAEAFNLFLQRMARFVERERAFTDDAGHELRTPLAVISSTVELMRRQEDLPQTARDQLKRIERATAQMNALVESFLLLAREEGGGGAVVQDAAHVVALALDTLRQARPKDAQRLTVVALEPCQVRAPEAVLVALVSNLVGNALSHTSGAVRIQLKNQVLSVHDEGDGITPAALDEIFDRRARGAASDGYGLGLFLVKRICTHLNWALHVRSRVDHGSCFEVGFAGRLTNH